MATCRRRIQKGNMRNTDHHAPKSGRKVVRRTTWLVTIIVTGMLVPLDARAEDDVIDIASRAVSGS